MAEQGAQIRYLGNDLGLQGWLTVKDGQVQYVYVTPNQEAYIAGVLLDRNGEIITTQQIETLASRETTIFETVASTETPQQAPAATSSGGSPAEQLYAAFEGADWFEIGSAEAPLVYALIDPDCEHCHAFVEALLEADAYNTKRIRTRLVPVGITSAESLQRAAFLVRAPNAGDAFLRHLGGDMTAIPRNDNGDTQAVISNMTLIQNWNLTETPFIVYRSGAGEVKIIRGKPQNINTLLSDLS